MDDWLKGVIAGSGAVLVATAWSMRSTEKLLKEAEIDFANPEFGVTPKEDFSDSVRQNLAVGGYSFNAESPSGDDPTAADPTAEGGPAELFDESVVQDEQDSGVDFMNAESPLEESPLSEDPLTEEPSDMGGPEDFSAENYGSKDARRAQWARRMKGKAKHGSEDRMEQGYNDRDDESIGVRNTTTGEQSLKDRRDESKGMTGSLNPHHPYSDVSTMSAETKGPITFNARQFVDKLREVDERLYEEALDTIAWEGYGRVGTWEDDEEGNMILLEDEDMMETKSAEARRWRLPKTSKGTALYAKRDESGRFTDIQNVARSTRADRARIASNQGVKSGKGDEGERMIYEAEFQTLTDHVSTMYAAESQDLILCAHCDKKMSECVPHSSEIFEAPASGYPVFMSAKDAAAVFAKNKNKLCTVTFMKKDGTMRTMRGRTGVFRDKSGKTIVGTGKKPSWDAKARAAAGYMTFFDVEAAKKAGDNRKGFRMINLNTITEIKAMGRTFDGAHPQGF